MKFLVDIKQLANQMMILIFAVLIEKILRIQPDIGKLFLIIRADDSTAALNRLRNEVRSILALT